MRVRAYISGALTDLPKRERDRMKRFYEELGRVFEEEARAHGIKNPEGYVPHLTGDPIKFPNLTPDEVLEMDEGHVEKTHLLVIVTTFPSYGAGREHEWARRRRIPIIAIGSARRNKARRISRLAKTSDMRQVYYNRLNQAPELFRLELRKLLASRKVRLRMVLRASRRRAG